MPKPGERLQRWVFQEVLGTGSYGTVWSAWEAETARKVAVKVIDKSGLDESHLAGVRLEIEILGRAVHPYIIRMHDMVETDEAIHIVMEYATGGDLYHQISLHGPLREAEACRLFAQLIIALHYCHSVVLCCHGDIKLENMLFDSVRTRNVKLVDFGLGSLISESRVLHRHRGTPAYAAPEVIANSEDGYDGPAADIWSAGVVLFVMLCGYLPFEDESFFGLSDKICAGQYEMAATVSKEAQDLIAGLLDVDATERFTVSDIMGHPWCTSFQAFDDNPLLHFKRTGSRDHLPSPGDDPGTGMTRVQSSSTLSSMVIHAGAGAPAAGSSTVDADLKSPLNSVTTVSAAAQSSPLPGLPALPLPAGSPAISSSKRSSIPTHYQPAWYVFDGQEDDMEEEDDRPYQDQSYLAYRSMHVAPPAVADAAHIAADAAVQTAEAGALGAATGPSFGQAAIDDHVHASIASNALSSELAPRPVPAASTAQVLRPAAAPSSNDAESRSFAALYRVKDTVYNSGIAVPQDSPTVPASSLAPHVPISQLSSAPVHAPAALCELAPLVEDDVSAIDEEDLVSPDFAAANRLRQSARLASGSASLRSVFSSPNLQLLGSGKVPSVQSSDHSAGDDSSSAAAARRRRAAAAGASARTAAGFLSPPHGVSSADRAYDHGFPRLGLHRPGQDGGAARYSLLEASLDSMDPASLEPPRFIAAERKTVRVALRHNRLPAPVYKRPVTATADRTSPAPAQSLSVHHERPTIVPLEDQGSASHSTGMSSDTWKRLIELEYARTQSQKFHYKESEYSLRHVTAAVAATTPTNTPAAAASPSGSASSDGDGSMDPRATSAVSVSNSGGGGVLERSSSAPSALFTHPISSPTHSPLSTGPARVVLDSSPASGVIQGASIAAVSAASMSPSAVIRLVPYSPEVAPVSLSVSAATSPVAATAAPAVMPDCAADVPARPAPASNSVLVKPVAAAALPPPSSSTAEEDDDMGGGWYFGAQ